jgi:hypothetical protein
MSNEKRTATDETGRIDMTDDTEGHGACVKQ